MPGCGQGRGVDDRDLMSKKIFSFLMFVFTLVETGEKGTAPIVTIPTGSALICTSFQAGGNNVFRRNIENREPWQK